MPILKAVIGANYGDEGKGYLTDCLCAQAQRKGSSAIVICSNGGAQRGHTVENEAGERFVFHHLGSGSLRGIGTFFCADFIMNPMLFRKDWEAFLKIREDSAELPVLMADPQCRFSTPYDMIVNQAFEDARGSQRHGSVGIGIWETVRRYEKGHGKPLGEMLALTHEEQLAHLQDVRTYAEQRIRSRLGVGPAELPNWTTIWNSEELAENFLADLQKMAELMAFSDIQCLKTYDEIIVENAQGVLLTQDRYDGTNYTTPSDTGAKQIRRLLESGLESFVSEVELHYVTRSYLTKHGAGNFPGECRKEELCPAMYDATNMPNEYQGTLRYGHLDTAALFRTIAEDRQELGKYAHTAALLVTHLNEVKQNLSALKQTAEAYGLKLCASAGKTEAFYKEA